MISLDCDFYIRGRHEGADNLLCKSWPVMFSQIAWFLQRLHVSIDFIRYLPGFSAVPVYFNHVSVGPGPIRNDFSHIIIIEGITPLITVWSPVFSSRLTFRGFQEERSDSTWTKKCFQTFAAFKPDSTILPDHPTSRFVFAVSLIPNICTPQNVAQHLIEGLKKFEPVAGTGPVPRVQQSGCQCSTFNRFYKRQRWIIHDDISRWKENSFIQGKMKFIVGKPVSLEPLFGRLSHFLHTVAGKDDMKTMFIQCWQEVSWFRVWLVLVAVLITVDGVYRSVKILYRAVSFPNVESGPLIWRWKIFVDFFQRKIEWLAEWPEGVIYVNYCYLAQSCFILLIICFVASRPFSAYLSCV